LLCWGCHTKYGRQSDLTSRQTFISCRSRCSQIWLRMRAVFLTHIQPPSCCILLWLGHSDYSPPSNCVELGLHPNSLHPKYLSKSHSHIPLHWGLWLPHRNFAWRHNSAHNRESVLWEYSKYEKMWFFWTRLKCATIWKGIKNYKSNQVLVAHSYLGGWDWEDHGSRPVGANSLRDPHLSK
jgi:hypothetical protein